MPEISNDVPKYHVRYPFVILKILLCWTKKQSHDLTEVLVHGVVEEFLRLGDGAVDGSFL